MLKTAYSYIKIVAPIAVFGLGLHFSNLCSAQETKKETIEPVFRIPKIDREPSAQQNKPDATVNVRSQTNADSPVERVADASVLATPAVDKKSVPVSPELNLAATSTAHPLDRAVVIAKNGLKNIRDNIQDYSAILVKRERVGEKLSEPEYMKIKIRNPHRNASGRVPFSIYMKFIKPRGSAGREVIWVEGQNSNKLIAHEMSPMLRFKNFYLDPDGFVAMKGNKYPVYEAGLEKLVLKLIEKAERDRAAGHCEVRYLEGAQINKRPCTLIEVVHKERMAPYEFHRAKVYIDDELQIPIRFVSYDWPAPGGKPRILEEYTYVNVKLNVGLSDDDFNIANPGYNFAK